MERDEYEIEMNASAKRSDDELVEDAAEFCLAHTPASVRQNQFEIREANLAFPREDYGSRGSVGEYRARQDEDAQRARYARGW